MSRAGAHVPKAEGEEQWLHRLPSPIVIEDRADWIVEAVRGRPVVHLGFADIGCERTRLAGGSWLHARLAESASRLIGLDLTAAALDPALLERYETFEVDCTQADAVAALGIGELFGPGTPTTALIEYIQGWFQSQQPTA